MNNLDKDYDVWFNSIKHNNIDREELNHNLLEELKFLSSMSVEEYTLYRKWQELQKKYTITDNSFFNTGLPEDNIKNNIWIPENPDDYKKLEPKLISAIDNKEMGNIWSTLKYLASTMINRSMIGRSLRFVVIDNITGKYLGIICLSSDFLDLTSRDEYIGWSREIKTQGKMINHTAIGSTIIPTQPLGYNYLGGKLLALLILSKQVEDLWNYRYKDKLVGITTTSLYGSYSQYNGLKYWLKKGHTSGSIKYEPSEKIVLRIRDWLKSEYPKKYWEWYVATRTDGLPLKRDHKQRSLSFAYSKMGIDKKYIQADHKRGVYFCPLFTNTREYLRTDITDGLVRRFDNSIEALTELWKEKYARKRIGNILEKNVYKDKILFYNDMVGVAWEEVKEKYLGDVGR